MLFSSLLNIFYPPQCPICSAKLDRAGNLCPDCFFLFEFVCENSQQETAAVYYNEISKKIILPFKYADKTELKELMSKLMIKANPSVFQGVDVITGVPIHWKRLFKRKYNQSFLLAQSIGKKTEIPSDVFLLKRVKNTLKAKNKKERFKNVKQAFVFNPKKNVKGKTILIVDDVLATGATTQACKQILLNNGAKEVRVLVFARTPEL